jgi:hypothetical protein
LNNEKWIVFENSEAVSKSPFGDRGFLSSMIEEI